VQEYWQRFHLTVSTVSLPSSPLQVHDHSVLEHKGDTLMSTHSYSRCWLHLVWETLRREPMLDKRAAVRASTNLTEYSLEKGIYMKINYFNADHTHALIDLPTNLTIEQVIQLLKGSSSHWINQNHLVKGRFA
jgi:REP element-mobilizing transposase RayT